MHQIKIISSIISSHNLELTLPVNAFTLRISAVVIPVPGISCFWNEHSGQFDLAPLWRHP